MKHYLLLFCTLLIAITAKGQVIFHGGALAGVSTSQVSGDQLSGFNKAGIYAGAFVNLHITDKWLFQFEIDYIQKGSRKNPKPSRNDFTKYVMNLQYFEVPILFKWEFLDRFQLEMGPAVGYLIKNTGVERDENGPFVDPRPAFSKIDLSVMGGVSFKIIEHLKLNIRGSQSVLPIRQHESGAVYRLNRGQYNSVLAFTLHLEY
jgi:hypothetical protein